MAVKNSQPATEAVDIVILDDLIRKFYRKILKQTEKQDKAVKLGEFLKMIELRRKLMPDDADQKQFWNMLEKVRRQTLPGKSVTAAPSTAHASVESIAKKSTASRSTGGRKRRKH